MLTMFPRMSINVEIFLYSGYRLDVTSSVIRATSRIFWRGSSELLLSENRKELEMDNQCLQYPCMKNALFYPQYHTHTRTERVCNLSLQGASLRTLTVGLDPVE